jgi:hypothetical protein
MIKMYPLLSTETADIFLPQGDYLPQSHSFTAGPFVQVCRKLFLLTGNSIYSTI